MGRAAKAAALFVEHLPLFVLAERHRPTSAGGQLVLQLATRTQSRSQCGTAPPSPDRRQDTGCNGDRDEDAIRHESVTDLRIGTLEVDEPANTSAARFVFKV